jgi:hypothetical protein
MKTVTLKYIDTSGAIKSETLSVLDVRGFDDPDEIQLVPPIVNRFMDGSTRTDFKGFRRAITIDCGVIHDEAVHRALLGFLRADVRSVTYENAGRGEELIVATDTHSLTSMWIRGLAIGKRFLLRVIENAIRSVWTDYTPASGVDIMHCKLKVEITGTQAAPETFVTNAGKLATMENGAQFPTISLLTWVASVVAVSYQEAEVNIIGTPTNSGTNLTFQLAVSDAGKASSDGKYYADILVLLQART